MTQLMMFYLKLTIIVLLNNIQIKHFQEHGKAKPDVSKI